MTRRDWFVWTASSVVTLASSLSGLLVWATSEPSYTYDWWSGWTDDPAMRDVGAFPPPKRITIDGREIDLVGVLRATTGPNGSVIVAKTATDLDPQQKAVAAWLDWPQNALKPVGMTGRVVVEF